MGTLNRIYFTLIAASAAFSAFAADMDDARVSASEAAGRVNVAGAIAATDSIRRAEGADFIMDVAEASDVAAAGSAIKTDSIPGLTLFNGQPNIYDMPYSISGNYPNYRRLAGNTAVLVAGGAAALIILECLPENSTQWDRKDIKDVPFFQRYYNNVIRGPHWDGDTWFFNYVLHPYAGAAYFMSARSQGFNMWYSALYSFCISTFFWEYGVEAFMERPSIQDLIVTPVVGSIIGEFFYRAKRHIVHNDYRLLGSKPLGYVVAFLLDPVNEMLGYFRGNHAHSYYSRNSVRRHIEPEVSLTPTATTGCDTSLPPMARLGNRGFTPGFNLTVTF